MGSFADLNEKEFLDTVNERELFFGHNGMTITSVKDGRAEGDLEISPHSLNIHGFVHGGCLATLADTVSGCAVFSATRRRCVTVNYNLNFLVPAYGSTIHCSATPQKIGRTLCVYDTVLTDDQDHLVASGTFTFYLLPDEEG